MVPILRKEDQEELNLELYRAISNTAKVDKKKALEAIKDLLERGADPTAIISVELPTRNPKPNDPPTTTYKIQVLSGALSWNDIDYIKAILENSKHVIDLTSPYIIPKRTRLQRNVLQYALAECTVDISKKLLEYGEAKGQNLFTACNQDVLLHTPQGTKIASLLDLLVFSVTSLSFMSDYFPVGREKLTFEERQAIKKQIDAWKTQGVEAGIPYEPMKEPIHLGFRCRPDAMKLLYDRHLVDRKATSITTDVFIDTLNAIDLTGDDTVSLDSWYLAYGVLISNISSMPITRENISKDPVSGEVLITKAFKSTTFGAEQTFVIHITSQKAYELTEAYFSAPDVTEFVRRTSFNATKARLEALEAQPAARRARFEKEFAANAISKDCFDRVYDLVYHRILAYKLATTGIFATKITDDAVQVLKLAQSAFKIAIDAAAVPGAAAIPAITGWFVNKYDEAVKQEKSKGIDTATKGFDLQAVAVDVAGLIAYQVMLVNGRNTDGKLVDKLLAHVATQIDSLGALITSGKCVSQEQVVGYLANTAMQHFKVAEHPHRKSLVKTGSGSGTGSDSGSVSVGTGSASVGRSSGEPQLVAVIKDEEDKGKRSSPGGCCTVS